MTFEHYAETVLIEHSRLQRLAFNQHGETTMTEDNDTRPWTAVPMAELQEIWAARTKTRSVFNGHTMFDLRAKYGDDNVKHVTNDGFYVRKPLAS